MPNALRMHIRVCWVSLELTLGGGSSATRQRHRHKPHALTLARALERLSRREASKGLRPLLGSSPFNQRRAADTGARARHGSSSIM